MVSTPIRLAGSKVCISLRLIQGQLNGISNTGPESCGIVAPPHTVSVSYLQDESTVTPAFANRQCSEYAKVFWSCGYIWQYTYHFWQSLDLWERRSSIAVAITALLETEVSASMLNVCSSFLYLFSPLSSRMITTDEPVGRSGTVFNPGFPVRSVSLDCELHSSKPIFLGFLPLHYRGRSHTGKPRINGQRPGRCMRASHLLRRRLLQHLPVGV